MIFGRDKVYRLGKARQRMVWANSWYKQHHATLAPREKEELEKDLSALDAALLRKDREEASVMAKKLEAFIEPRYKRSLFSYIKEIVVALAVALFIASLVRMMWFENQEIPSGSMRPTYKEQDCLIVNKVPFGINIPFATGHFYFDPELVKRTMSFIFSADNISMPEADTTYFGLFPYKKRLIKRVMGKPGDTLYFYGGQVYGFDGEGRPLKELIDSPWMQKLEYIPFMSFSGEVEQTRAHTFILKQMNEPLGKISLTPQGQLSGEIYVKGAWQQEKSSSFNAIDSYGDFWGIKNYAMVQLLTREQVAANGDAEMSKLPSAPLYLEIRHDPALTAPAPRLFSRPQGSLVALTPYRTYLPMDKEHLAKLMANLYTARFVVEKGQVRRYTPSSEPHPVTAWRVSGVKDGTYEFYEGKASEIKWAGIAYPLAEDSPLYPEGSETIQNYFNLGIDLHPAFMPRGSQQLFFPHRYAYFRNGDLYIMGAPIFSKDDPQLADFKRKEQEREQNATKAHPYIAFKDYGPPVNANGDWDASFIKTFGLKIPPGHYLALGDNHAMSGDSRLWGFVPEANIQATPTFVYWPPSPRWGTPKDQPIVPWLTIPHFILWGILLTTFIAFVVWRSYSRRKPIFVKL